MGSEFLVYLRLGFEHISDLAGYDHIVFVVALCAVYSVRQWRNMLGLVTAFTIGHSVTLALATFRLVTIDADLVEILIPVTILAVCVLDFREAWFKKSNSDAGEEGEAADSRSEGGSGEATVRAATTHSNNIALVPWKWKYALAMTFGLVHGLGFSNFLRAILGGDESITLPLFAFNIGLEAGQIAILFTVLTVSYLIIRLTRMPGRIWSLLLSVTCSAVALTMIATRLGNL